MAENVVFICITDVPRFSSRQSLKRNLKSICISLLGPSGLISGEASSLLTVTRLFSVSSNGLSSPCTGREVRISGLSSSYKDTSPTVLKPHP